MRCSPPVAQFQVNSKSDIAPVKKNTSFQRTLDSKSQSCIDKLLKTTSWQSQHVSSSSFFPLSVHMFLPALADLVISEHPINNLLVFLFNSPNKTYHIVKLNPTQNVKVCAHRKVEQFVFY